MFPPSSSTLSLSLSRFRFHKRITKALILSPKRVKNVILSLTFQHASTRTLSKHKQKEKKNPFSFLFIIHYLPLEISKHYKKMGPSKSIILLSYQLVMGVPWPALQVITLQEDGSEQYWVLILKPCMEHVWWKRKWWFWCSFNLLL